MEYRNYVHNIVIFIICAALYLINKITKIHELDEEWWKYIWDYNFTDYLCQIVYFSLANITLNRLGSTGIYSIRRILFFTIVCCFVWEIVISWLRNGTTFDWYDCLAYFLGGLTYYSYFYVLHRNGGTSNEKNS